MTPELEEKIRNDYKSRLNEYLCKTTYREDKTGARCPVCGDENGIIAYNGTWQCTKDRSHAGDTLDYAYYQYKCKDLEHAAKIVQHVLSSNIDFFNCISSTALLDTEFSSMSQYLVENIMGKGLYLLSGAPKIGKSWLVLWLADRISRGLPVWEFATEKSSVLYISLEDTLQRLQSRLCDISPGENSDLMITTKACLLGDGFEEQLGRYLCEFPKTGLVIIDTLQRIRKNTNQYNYGDDYDFMNTLKQIADKYNTTILLVHHNRKMDSNDPIDNISGTAGLSGAVDGMMILTRRFRGKSEATLYITGRDHPDTTISLSFNKQTKLWDRLPDDADDIGDDTDPLLEKINLLLSNSTYWSGTATELISALKLTNEKANTISRKLNCKKGHLLQKYNISYTTYRNSDSRVINLNRNK